MAVPDPTIEDLWARYYPGQTPEQVRADAVKESGTRDSLYRAQLAAMKARHECRNSADLELWWKKVVDAKTALHRHDGVPGVYISEHGDAVIPDGICQACWKPGAVADGLGDDGYHVECRVAMSVRCDLRSAYFARISGDEGRVAMWERLALSRLVGCPTGPDAEEATPNG